MHIPEQVTYYLLEDRVLDKLATEVYGRLYVGQQTGDMYGNDTYLDLDMSVEYVESIVLDDMEFEGYERPDTFHGQVRRYFEGMLPLRKWREYPDGEYDFDHVRIGPSPETMLAYLIRDMHLPYGRYLLHIWW